MMSLDRLYIREWSKITLSMFFSLGNYYKSNCCPTGIRWLYEVYTGRVANNNYHLTLT